MSNPLAIEHMEQFSVLYFTSKLIHSLPHDEHNKFLTLNFQETLLTIQT